MKLLRSLLRTLSAFILGVGIACSVSPAVADITYQAASFLSQRVDALGTAIQFYVSGTGIASIEATGIHPFTDGNNTTSNLGRSDRGYKNIYLSDATNRSYILQSNGLYISGPSGQSIIFRNASTDVWSITSAGALSQNATNGGDILLNKDTAAIRPARVLGIYTQTSDGTDNGQVQIAGGGNTGSAGRGAYIAVNGNESSNGAISIVEGSNAGGVAITAGVTSHTGTITSSRSTDVGWSIVAVANQACNTTCTSACVFGQETTSKAILACTDATADSCLCAGAS